MAEPLKKEAAAGAGDSGPLRLTLDARDRGLRVSVQGPLTVDAPASAWKGLPWTGRGRGRPAGGEVLFDLAGVTALDLNGTAQFLTAVAGAEKNGFQARTTGLPERFSVIYNLAEQALKAPPAVRPEKTTFLAEAGRSLAALKDDLREMTVFAGEITAEFGRLMLHPLKGVRWPNVLSLAETAGVNSVPIVSLVSFLVGLIIAFQAAMLLKMFGAEIYVADLIGISVIRELGPLIAAIVLAGRTGSAFSAELGAMKAAEEVDAIATMGLSPVRELALPRVLASVLTTPVVTLIASFAGIVGGSLVLLLMGYSMKIFWLGAVSQVSLATYVIGIGKSFIFGFTLAAVGCQRGLAAGDGPGAVGQATTSGVVTNIVLIVIIDSFLAVLFYVYDI